MQFMSVGRATLMVKFWNLAEERPFVPGTLLDTLRGTKFVFALPGIPVELLVFFQPSAEHDLTSLVKVAGVWTSAICVDLYMSSVSRVLRLKGIEEYLMDGDR